MICLVYQLVLFCYGHVDRFSKTGPAFRDAGYFCVDLFVHIFFLILAFDHVTEIEFDSLPKISSDFMFRYTFQFLHFRSLAFLVRIDMYYQKV